MPELPLWLFEMKHLESLVLKWCHLEGFIPSSVGKLTKLKHLNLSDNNLCGELPGELEQLCLHTLILTNNKGLSGDIKLQSTTCCNFDGTNVRRVGLKDMIVQV
jgi:Leucine-rich repeat (LRR) protein